MDRPQHHPVLQGDVGEHPPRRVDDPMLEAVLGQNPGPAIEQLHNIGTRFNLAQQVGDGSIDDQFDQPSEALRVAVSPCFDPPKIAAGSALNKSSLTRISRLR